MLRSLVGARMVLFGLWGVGSIDFAAAQDALPPAATAADTARPPSVAAPSAEQIRKWILQLGGNSFEGREEATRLLSAAGMAAIKPLTDAALQDGNLELTIRAIRALQSIYAYGDDAEFDTAEKALEQIGEAEHPHAARRAAEALRTRAAIRQERAIARIQSLGGAVKLQQL